MPGFFIYSMTVVCQAYGGQGPLSQASDAEDQTPSHLSFLHCAATKGQENRVLGQPNVNKISTENPNANPAVYLL